MNSLHKTITLAHGSGGRLTHELVQRVFRPAFSNPALNVLDDAAEITGPAGSRLAVTTDAFVVQPLFFPGGDIGRLSVCGTVNDLCMKGARPLAITLAAVIEEGFSMATLRKIVNSAARAAREARISIVAGDTKVVRRGEADGVFLVSAGVGRIRSGVRLSGTRLTHGDRIIASGPIGDHGLAVLLAREKLSIKGAVRSDCAPLGGLVECLLRKVPRVHILRDPTRGGLATTINEFADSSGIGVILEEQAIPVRRSVRAACALLGIDPLYAACEGRLVAAVSAADADDALAALRSHLLGRGASIIGTATRSERGVWLQTRAGGIRPLIMLEGEQLPRIC